MSAQDLAYLSLREAAELVRQRRVSPVELTRAAMDRADALGLLGVVIYGLLAGALLKLVDSLVTRVVPLWMALSVVIVPIFMLFTSADLMTTLLTHGLGFAVFMLYLMKRPHPVRTNPGRTAPSEPRPASQATNGSVAWRKTA